MSSKTIAFIAAVLSVSCGGSSDSGLSGGAGGTGAGDASVGGSSGSAGSAGSAGSGGSGGSAGNGGAAGNAGTAGGAGTAGSAGTAGNGGGPGCSPACGTARECCGNECVNLANDPRNCGKCEQKCSDGQWCNGSGKCEKRPCAATCADKNRCCGSTCCGAGEICCDAQGPISTGPVCTKPSDSGTCPQGCAPLCQCASPDTLIATPTGQRAIADLKAGDLIYSMHRGELVSVPLLSTQRVTVTKHKVVRLTFQGGARIEMSASHPTADGRSFGDLKAGQSLDGVLLTDTRVIAYQHEATHDILPDSDSGAYFAAGVLVGSTMKAQPAVVVASAARCDAP